MSDSENDYATTTTTTTNKQLVEMAVIRKRFGDEYSTLLDEFERKSFEAHMNRSMLGRSLSEPGMPRSQSLLISMAPIPLVTQVMQGPRRGRGSAFQRVLKKLFKPILGRKRREGRKQVPDPKDLLFCKDFSRSLRFWYQCQSIIHFLPIMHIKLL